MKKIAFILCAAFIAFCAFIPSSRFKASITGSIDPADAAKKVWAISGKDTLSSVPMSGKFAVEVTAGTWKLVVEAVPPYKSTVIDNVQAQEGQATDVGVIRLTQ